MCVCVSVCLCVSVCVCVSMYTYIYILYIYELINHLTGNKLYGTQIHWLQGRIQDLKLGVGVGAQRPLPGLKSGVGWGYILYISNTIFISILYISTQHNGVHIWWFWCQEQVSMPWINNCTHHPHSLLWAVFTYPWPTSAAKVFISCYILYIACHEVSSGLIGLIREWPAALIGRSRTATGCHGDD